MQERDYQLKAESSVLHEYDAGVRRMLLNLATGTGKTIVFSRLYDKLKSRLPGQMIVLAHRKELIGQNADKMRLVNPSIKVDIEMGSEHADLTSADVISASVQTLGRKDTKRIEKYTWSQIDKLVIDEAHHSTAEGYANVLDLFGAMEPGTKKLTMGFTATPQRPDGKALATVFEKIAYVYSLRKAIKDGWLVDIKGFRVNTDIDLDAVAMLAGDLAEGQLNDTVNTPGRNKQIVQAWKDTAYGRPTVAFTAGIQHAKDLSAMFRERGVAAEAVWGDDPDRAEKLQLHREGKIVVLCNCGVLVEGYDDWRISCVILARPTKSAALFAQMIGRGTRLQDGCGNLKLAKFVDDGFIEIHGCKPFIVKYDCIVIDVVDISKRHSLQTLPTLMGLPSVLDLKGQSLLWTAEALENLQEENPTIDFTKLGSLADMKQFIEQINLFEVKFPTEIESNSELSWHPALEGGYRINIPTMNGENGRVRVYQNTLDLWEVEGDINDELFHATRPTMEHAFRTADTQIMQRTKTFTQLCLKQKLKSDADPATPGQLKFLHQLFSHKIFVEVTKGQARHLISQRIDRKRKKK
jgi:superfamily II DNA or RNA helicase